MGKPFSMFRTQPFQFLPFLPYLFLYQCQVCKPPHCFSFTFGCVKCGRFMSCRLMCNLLYLG